MNGAPVSAAELPTGWTVLWSNDEWYASEALAARLSLKASAVVAVHVNETCMHATSSLFQAGKRQWRVHHEGDEQIDVLEKEGDLPDEVSSIESDCRARQAGEDNGAAEMDWLFEIPLGVAKGISGFQHDESVFAGGETVFTAVETGAPKGPAKSWRS